MAAGGPLLSCVVAVAENGVIGKAGRLPWRLKSDLKRFRKLTMGHPLIMGRKTFESIGKALDGRDSIVVSRNPSHLPQEPGIFHAASWPEAISVASRQALLRGVNEVFVIGGASLFAEALADCKRIYLTRVHGSPDGDILWTPPGEPEWQEIGAVAHDAGPGDDFAVTDVILERRM